MVYVHGHAACVQQGCPMFGANQAECCDGETASQSVAATADVAALPHAIQIEAPHAPDSVAALREAMDADPALSGLLTEARARLDQDDPGHDLEHALRVALWTLRLGEGALSVRHVVAAALFHDLVNLPKNHPERHLASTQSADVARPLLAAAGFTPDEITLVADAIRDHSFSRGVTPVTLLGRALQDADRLEALGVLGLFRTISTGTRMGARYFHAQDPWAKRRALDDQAFSVDHFTTKLLKLASTLCTARGREEASRRAERMRQMLVDLGEELGEAYAPHESLR
jgi:uncharacterized protein